MTMATPMVILMAIPMDSAALADSDDGDLDSSRGLDFSHFSFHSFSFSAAVGSKL